MLVRGRTLLLILVVIQLCLQYSIFYEVLKSINSAVQLTVFDVKYPYLFDLLLAIILVPAMLFNIILFVYGLRTHTKRKKKFVVFVFGFHFIILVPYYISGIYLYMCTRASGATKLNKEVHKIFKDFREVLNVEREFEANDTALTDVLFIQKTFCCCGLHGPQDWGETFEKEDHNATVIFGSIIFSCPIPTLYKDSQCIVPHFEGCASKVIRVKRSFILISSIICLCCSIIAILISPCIYASFEHDRRLARASYIRSWRKNLEAELDRERREDYEDDAPTHMTGKVEKNELLAATQSDELSASEQSTEEESGSMKEEIGLNKNAQLNEDSAKSLLLSRNDDRSLSNRSLAEKSDETTKPMLKFAGDTA